MRKISLADIERYVDFRKLYEHGLATTKEILQESEKFHESLRLNIESIKKEIEEEEQFYKAQDDYYNSIEKETS